MKISLNELCILILPVLLGGVIVLLSFTLDGIKDDNSSGSQSSEADAEVFNERQSPSVKLLRAKPLGENKKSKSGADSRIKISEDQIGDLEVAESQHEFADLLDDILVELGLQEDELDEYAAALFSDDQMDEYQDEAFDGDDESTLSLNDIESEILDGLKDLDLLVQEHDSTIETESANLESDELGEIMASEEKELASNEEESDIEIVNPFGESEISEEMIQDLVEKIYEEVEGISFQEELPEEENEFLEEENESTSISDEDLEEIVYDFQNFGMSMEEIDEIIRMNSDDESRQIIE